MFFPRLNLQDFLVERRFDQRPDAWNQDPTSQRRHSSRPSPVYLRQLGIAPVSPSNDQSNAATASATQHRTLGDEQSFVLWQMKNLIYWRRAAWL
jgi:hypothetical protein